MPQARYRDGGKVQIQTAQAVLHPLELYGQDTEGFEPSRKRRIRVGFTCSDGCHTVHRNRVAARLHWLWLQAVARPKNPAPPPEIEPLDPAGRPEVLRVYSFMEGSVVFSDDDGDTWWDLFGRQVWW